MILRSMIDFWAAHDIGAQVDVIAADQLDEAYERLLAGDGRYRFVIDIATLSSDWAVVAVGLSGTHRTFSPAIYGLEQGLAQLGGARLNLFDRSH
jgi:hypothetical protein